MDTSGAYLSSNRIRVGAESRTTPTTAKRYPSANSFAANMGICRGDQFVLRKVRVSKRSDRPAAKSAYPTHRLGGIAIIELDSTHNAHVPRTFGQGYESDSTAIAHNRLAFIWVGCATRHDSEVLANGFAAQNPFKRVMTNPGTPFQFSNSSLENLCPDVFAYNYLL